MRRRDGLILLAGLVAGCGGEVTQPYHSGTPKIAAGTQRLSFAVLDHRPYVVSKAKPEKFTGALRATDGSLNDVFTASGLPLADDVAATVARSLRARGAEIVVLALPPSVSTADARARLTGSGGKSVLVILQDWRSESAASAAVHYDLSARVFDSSGKTIGESAIKGSDYIGSALAARYLGASKLMADKLQALFDAPEIAGAI